MRTYIRGPLVRYIVQYFPSGPQLLDKKMRVIRLDELRNDKNLWIFAQLEHFRRRWRCGRHSSLTNVGTDSFCCQMSSFYYFPFIQESFIIFANNYFVTNKYKQ